MKEADERNERGTNTKTYLRLARTQRQNIISERRQKMREGQVNNSFHELRHYAGEKIFCHAMFTQFETPC